MRFPPTYKCLIYIVFNFVQLQPYSLHSSAMCIFKNIGFVRVIQVNDYSCGSFISTAVWNFIVWVYQNLFICFPVDQELAFASSCCYKKILFQTFLCMTPWHMCKSPKAFYPGVKLLGLVCAISCLLDHVKWISKGILPI